MFIYQYSKQQPKCELCKGNLLLSNVVYLPCGNNHILCKGCFKDSLLKRGPRCPSCNEPIPRKQEFPIPEAKRYRRLLEVIIIIGEIL